MQGCEMAFNIIFLQHILSMYATHLPLTPHFCDITFCYPPIPPPSFSSSLPYSGISVLSLSPPPLLWDAAYSLMPAVCQVLATYFPLTPNRSLLQQSGREGGESASTGSRAQEKRRGEKSNRALPSI